MAQYCHHGLILVIYNVYLLQFHKEKVNILMNLEKNLTELSQQFS